MYARPPLVHIFSVTTSAAINTDTTTVILAAPALATIRLVRVIWIGSQNTTGNLRGLLIEASTGLFLSVGPGRSGAALIDNLPEPGYACAFGSALSIVHASNVASQVIRGSVFYFADPYSP